MLFQHISVSSVLTDLGGFCSYDETPECIFTFQYNLHTTGGVLGADTILGDLTEFIAKCKFEENVPESLATCLKYVILEDDPEERFQKFTAEYLTRTSADKQLETDAVDCMVHDLWGTFQNYEKDDTIIEKVAQEMSDTIHLVYSNVVDENRKTPSLYTSWAKFEAALL